MAHTKLPTGEGFEHAIIEVHFRLATHQTHIYRNRKEAQALLRVKWQNAGKIRWTGSRLAAAQLVTRGSGGRVLQALTQLLIRNPTNKYFFPDGEPYPFMVFTRAYNEWEQAAEPDGSYGLWSDEERERWLPHFSWSVSPGLAKWLKPSLNDGEMTIEV